MTTTVTLVTALAALGLVQNNVTATVAPAVTNDGTQGYAAGSMWLNTTTGMVWVCRNAATGAAEWEQLGVNDHPGYVSGLYYPMSDAGAATGTAVPAIDTIYWSSFAVKRRVSVAALSLAVTLAGTASSWKGGVYANGPGGRALGAPILVNNTGAATTAAAWADLTMAGNLNPGIYWFAQKHTGTLPQTLSKNPSGLADIVRGGRLAVPTSTSIQTALSTSDTYSNSMPTMTGAESYTNAQAGGVPVPWLKVA